ncbi:MAG: hypothetical protein PVJ86_01400 [Phycisphaerales bacterium]|jgi:hypothetical protein
MRASEVVEQLRRELPKRTDLFTDSLQITSLTRSGSAVTAVTSAPHNLSNGDFVVIDGAKELNPITSLTFADGIASAITQNNHDLTLASANQVRFGDFSDYNYADVTGANEAEYNGIYLLSAVPNRKNFSYAITGSPSSPATGSPALEQEGGYNGRFEVTVVDPTTFIYQISTTPISPAGGTITGYANARISADVSLKRVIQNYTAQARDKYWAFAVLGDVLAVKDRNVLTDAIGEDSVQSEFRTRLIEPFRVFVIVPSIYDSSARSYQDNMENVRGFIYNSLAGFIFGTALTETPWCKTSPTGDRFVEEASPEAFYIHEFSFQRVVDVTYPDTVGDPRSGAFRDVSLTTGYAHGTGELTADINLDEQPLP